MKTTTKESPRGQDGPAGDERLRRDAQVEKRATNFGSQGGCRHGNDLEDWLQAEREVMKAGREREQETTIP